MANSAGSSCPVKDERRDVDETVVALLNINARELSLAGNGKVCNHARVSDDQRGSLSSDLLLL